MAEGDWVGARWVNCYGGPWDGTMTDIEFPVEFLGHITVWPRQTTAEHPEPLGTYWPVAWEDEELKIVRVEWRAGAAPDIRGR